MAHKPFVDVTTSWLDLTAAIEDYDATKTYNTQNLTQSPMWFHVGATAPSVGYSYTVANQEDVVVIPVGVVGVWVKTTNAAGGKLSVEEAQ